ncbi:MAG: hypothetical protein WEB04_00180 [Dehalococcoidia bacterium]
MRILSLGLPLPGVPIDNYSFASAPSFFDYDALVVEPRALSQLIDEVAQGTKEHRLHTGERVVIEASGANEVTLAALLRRRRDETERLLERGGAVVCFAYPNDTQEFDRYCWLPAPEGIAYQEPFLLRGTGARFDVVLDDHPFAPLLLAWGEKLSYQACFAEDAGCAIARSAGGASVAIELRMGDGRIVFLPPLERVPAAEQRYVFSDLIQKGLRQTLRQASKSSAPGWVATYTLPVPAAGAEAAQNGPPGGLEALPWEEGRSGLGEPVRAALALLGFAVAPDDIDAPAQITFDGRTAFLQVEGGTSAIGIEAHYPLRRRLEHAIAQGRPKRGVLVINGHRTQDPASRMQQYTEPLRVAAETMRYCIVTTAQLHRAVRAALEGDGDAVSAFRERLLTTEGILQD